MHPRRLTYCNIYFSNYETYVIICNQSHIAYTVDFYSWVRDGAKSRGSDLKKRNWCLERQTFAMFFSLGNIAHLRRQKSCESWLKLTRIVDLFFALEFFSSIYIHFPLNVSQWKMREWYTIAYRRWTYILLTYVNEQKHSQNIEHEKIKNNYFAIGTNI